MQAAGPVRTGSPRAGPALSRAVPRPGSSVTHNG